MLKHKEKNLLLERLRIPELSADEVKRFWSRVNRGTEEECWEWLGCTVRGGYGQIWFSGKKYAAHRVAYVLAKGAIPQDKIVMHIFDNSGCCNPGHIKLGTLSENTIDSCIKMRRARFSASQIREIRRLQGIENPKQTADRYGVSRVMVYYIQSRKSYAFVL